MSCTDRRTRIALWALGLLSACATAPPGDERPAGPVTPAVRASAKPPTTIPAAPAGAALPAPATVRNWQEVRLQAAHRLVAANPQHTYTGVVPDQLLAIPVLEIELHGDGSVRRIEILRAPRQAHETVQMATDAVRRAAPFGDVSRLPKPWRFTETFLFNDEHKFKPRTLDN